MDARSWSVLGLAGALTMAGCTGVIGDPGGGEETGGAGGGGGAGGQALVCKPGVIDPGPNPMRRLTSVQFANTIHALFGTSIDPGDDFPVTKIKKGYRSYADSNIVSASGADGIRLSAEHVAAQFEANLVAIVGCDPVAQGEACVGGFIDSFGQRAYRRPLLAEERALFQGIYDKARSDGFSESEGLGMIVETTLQSPQFLYRAEIASPEGAEPGSVVPLDDWEMASRLSYLIWDTMPDEELMSLAAAGQLREKSQVEAQARRMLADPRAQSALSRFFEDWLELQRLDLSPKDAALFPEYGPETQQALREEIGRTAAHVMWNLDGRLETLLSAPVTVANAALAPIYGVSGPSGNDDWQPLSLDPARRAGILTTAAFLSSHANSQTSNPVVRGAFVRNQLLCDVLEPPDGLVLELPPSDPNVSKRDQLAQHRADPACAGCHDLMDPVGFGFENYDAIGRWRETEGNDIPIEPAGELIEAGDASGAFAGPVELVKLLAGSEIVQECVALHTFRFAAGRHESQTDGCSVQTARDRFRESGGDLKELMVALTQTDAFFHRRIAEVSP